MNEKEVQKYIADKTQRIKDLEADLDAEKDWVKHLRKKSEFDMPDEMRGHFHNGQCPDACDMIDGPCACGAWHSAKEWIGKLNRQLQTELDSAKEEANISKRMNKIDELQAENERLNELVYAYESVRAPINPLHAANQQLRDALKKIQNAKIANMKPNSVALYQTFVKETATKALEEPKPHKEGNK